MPKPLTKQPSESLLYDFSFAGIARKGDVLTSATITQSTVTGSGTLTIGAAAVSGLTAQARISGGVAGSQYKVTALGQTQAGDTVEVEGLLDVKDL